MAFVDIERLKMFAMRRSLGMTRNPKVTKAIVKDFEHTNKTTARIDETVNKMATIFGLVVRNEMIETNHSIRASEDNVRELTKTVGDLEKQMNQSTRKKRKADQRDN